jgi:hypothetical protein
MAVFRAGKGGRTRIQNAQGSTNLANQSWDITHSGDKLDTSNFEGNGKKSWLIGLESLSWRLGALFDANKNPEDDPPGLYVRDDGEGMQLFTNKTDNKYWNLPSWICDSSHMSVTVAGLVMYDASGMAQNDFEKITGSV